MDTLTLHAAAPLANALPQHLAIFGIGAPELLLIFAVMLLLFGAKKLPSLAKGLGQSIKEFKKATQEEDSAPSGKTDTPKSPEKTQDTGTTTTTES